MINPGLIKSICEDASGHNGCLEKDYTVTFKDDNSPFTLTDQESNEIITRLLKKHYPEIPIISEEMVKQVDYETRKIGQSFG